MGFFFVAVLAVLLQILAHPCNSLSVTNYGIKQISMMRHGEKYATNRDCYSWEDVQPKYHGMTHIRGLNDKEGLFTVQLSKQHTIKSCLAVVLPAHHFTSTEAECPLDLEKSPLILRRHE